MSHHRHHVLSHRLSGVDPLRLCNKTPPVQPCTTHSSRRTDSPRGTADDTPMLGSGWAQHVTQVSFFGGMAELVQLFQNLVGVRHPAKPTMCPEP
eukprot:s1645_g15.t1